MTLKQAIGSGVQSELYRGLAQYGVMVVAGLALFGKDIFTKSYDWDFTSREGIDSRILINLTGLVVTYGLAELFLSKDE
jgi:hypothetical protein